MKKIPLTQGREAMVDDEDYDMLMRHKWCLHSAGYGSRKVQAMKMVRTIFMHQAVIGAKAGYEIDHVNGNGLDNRGGNLRHCTHAQNTYHQRPHRRRQTSQYKGVGWRWQDEMWRVRIGVNHKSIYIGQFKDERVAARAYDEAARRYHGEFAWCNFD